MMPKKRTIPRALSERLMTLLAEGNHSAIDLANESNVSLLALARWAAQPQHVELLSGLVRLSNARAQIVLSQYRTSAAAKLIEHAMNGETGEISRKACVDLLKIELPIFDHEPEDSDHHDASPKLPSERAIRSALRELAARTEALMQGDPQTLPGAQETAADDEPS